MPAILVTDPLCKIIDITGDPSTEPSNEVLGIIFNGASFSHLTGHTHYRVFIHVLSEPLSEAAWFEAHIRVFIPHPITDSDTVIYYEGRRWDCDPITNDIQFSRFTPEFETDFSNQEVWENFALDLVDTYLAVQEPQPQSFEPPYSGPRPTRYEREWVI
jgi:hypothetical protein